MVNIRNKKGEAHIRNKISSILLYYIIVVMNVNICYNKVS